MLPDSMYGAEVMAVDRVTLTRIAGHLLGRPNLAQGQIRPKVAPGWMGDCFPEPDGRTRGQLEVSLLVSELSSHPPA
jgi:hypothetical protein